MEIIVAPDEMQVRVKDGVVVVSIEEKANLQIFLGSADAPQVSKVLSALYDVKVEEMGM